MCKGREGDGLLAQTKEEAMITVLQFVVSLMVGAFVGAVAMAIIAGGNKGPSLDECFSCRSNLCKGCQDVKALEEELLTRKRSKSQIVSENGRLRMAVARD